MGMVYLARVDMVDELSCSASYTFTRVVDCSNVGGAYPYDIRYGTSVSTIIFSSHIKSSIENDCTFDESCVSCAAD